MKEQLKRIEKRPGAEVQIGTLTAGVTQPTKMGAVKPAESNSDKLLKAFNVAAPAIGKIVENKVAEQDSIDKLEYTQHARDYANQKLLESEDIMDDDEKIEFLAQSHEFYMDTMRSQNVSSAGIQAGLGVVTNKFATAQESIFADKIKKKQEDLTNKAYTRIQELAIGGTVSDENGNVRKMTPQEVIGTIKSELNVSNAEAGKMYVTAVGSQLLEQVQRDVAAGKAVTWDNYKDILNSNLKIVREGVTYATHGVYGPMIDKIESDIKAALTAHDKTIKSTTYKSLYQQVHDIDPTKPADVAALRQKIYASAATLDDADFKSLTTDLDAAVTGKFIQDDYRNVEAVKNYILTNNVTDDTLTSDYFNKVGIKNPTTRQEIITLAKGNSGRLNTSNAKLYASTIDSLKSQDMFNFDPDLKRTVNSAKLAYSEQVAQGADPKEAFDKVMTYYGLQKYIDKMPSVIMKTNAQVQQENKKLVQQKLADLKKRLSLAKTIQEKRKLAMEIKELTKKQQGN